MLEKILQALHEEGYDAHIKDDIIFVSVDEFDLYRITVSSETIHLKSVDTGRIVDFNNFDKFLYFLES